MKKIISVLCITMMTLVGCTNGANDNIENDKLQVTVTINPLKEFAEIIGGDKVQVTSIIPDGVEPHDFDPKPRDLEMLGKSNIFIYNGLGMEEWIDNVVSTVDLDKTTVVDASKGVNVIETDEKVDPHIWLSLLEADKECKNILDILITNDPENKDYYTKNYNDFSKELINLHDEYTKKFEEVENKDFITGHAAFGYLCNEFQLEQKSLQDVYGEGELTAKTLEELVKFCKDNNVKVIFSESSASKEEANTLAKEVGVTVEKIYSLEAKEDDMSYIEGMKYNLNKIYLGLK